MSARQMILSLVSNLKPGQQIEISRNLLREVGSREYNGATFTPADNIMENIIGSAYEFWYQEVFATGNVIFGRLCRPLSDGGRTYTSPDRRYKSR